MKYKLAAILLLFMAANTPLSAQKVGWCSAVVEQRAFTT